MKTTQWCACLASAFGAFSSLAATRVTLFATNVPDPGSSWFDTSRAEGAPNSIGNDSQYAYTVTNDFLTATQFSAFTLPAGQMITHVWADVKARMDQGTSNNRVRLRVAGGVASVDTTSPAWSQGPNDDQFDWRFTSTSHGVEVSKSAWTQSDVNALTVAVRREGAVNTLRIDAFRIVVEYEADSDADGIPDSIDNCPGTFNSNQSDLDHDGLGDACDDDRDGDGVSNPFDCAPDDKTVWRSEAYPDPDGDGVPNSLFPETILCFGTAVPVGFTLNSGPKDNCPDQYNPGQEDLDHDGVGDVCNSDVDHDGVSNATDNCPLTYNPDQADRNGNGVGDICEAGSGYIEPAVDGRRITAYAGSSNTQEPTAPFVAFSAQAFQRGNSDPVCHFGTAGASGSAQISSWVTPLASQTVLSAGASTIDAGSGGSGTSAFDVTYIARQHLRFFLRATVTGGLTDGPAAFASYRATLRAEAPGGVAFELPLPNIGFGISNPETRWVTDELTPGRYIVRFESVASTGGVPCDFYAVANAGGTGFIEFRPLTDCHADFNGDLVVDDGDFVIFVRQYDTLLCEEPEMPNYCSGDINRDGMVNDDDFVLFVHAYNKLICV